MTTRTEAGTQKSFVSAYLPWILATLAAILYVLTLNRWLSFKNLQPFFRATGQAWFTDFYLPVFTLVTTPFRWLPEAWMPVALNLFSAICAVLVLALLTRSVQLLPHDRTLKQREREQSPFALLSIPTAWIAPALAVATCGLQLTFWEHATNLSNNMFDLLLFAYSVRCLLEYRIDTRESWLMRAAVVYAAGMTDTWVMVALMPAFLAAIIWIKGLSFFQLRFVARLFLCFLAGLAFYLYIPLMHARDGSFWGALKINATGEIEQVVYVVRYLPHYVQFLLALTSLLPLIVIGIRWKSYFGDTSQLGVTLTTWIFHLAHAVLLGVCLWAAFDPVFSLRDAQNKFQFLDIHRDRFLPLYYLAALSVGYFSGYFLLIFRPMVQRTRRPSELQKALNVVVTAIISLLLVLVSVGLISKNVPAIKITNGPAWQHYATAITENLPANGVILSDRADALIAAQAWLARSGKAKDFLFLETDWLKWPEYYKFQTRHNPKLWPQMTSGKNRKMVGDPGQLNLLFALSQNHPLYYLQPTFGPYLEAFYMVPHGMVYELKPYGTNITIDPPPLTEAVFNENENFWKQYNEEINGLVSAITAPGPEHIPSVREKLMTKMHVPFEQNATALQLGSVYSRALNTWGVQAQQMNHLETADEHFDLATRVFPDNVVASANSEFNKKLHAGQHVTVDNPAGFEERFGKFENWQQILNINGLFDEPSGCVAQGVMFARGNLGRQSAQSFERALVLAPDSLLARLWLARVYLISSTPEKAFPFIDELKTHMDSLTDSAIYPADVFQVELAANYTTKKTNQVEKLLSATLSRNPPDAALLDVATRISFFYKDYTNALLTAKKQLELNPNDVSRLLNVGFVQVQLGRPDEALVPLSQAVSLQPTNSTALLYRAGAYFQAGKLNDSQQDYEALLKLNPKAYPVYSNLGEVALRKSDTNAAIHYFELFLSAAPPNTPETKSVADRLKSLKPGSP